MNEFGRTTRPTTDDDLRAPASERRAWRPGPPPPDSRGAGEWQQAPGYPAPRYPRPQHLGPQQGGPQQGGPQSFGPRPAGPQHSGGPAAGPRPQPFAQPGSPYARQPVPGPRRPEAGPSQAPAGGGAGRPVRPAFGNRPGGPSGPVDEAAPVPPRRRGRVGRWIGLAVVLAALGGVGWYVTSGAPSPVTAAVGDCVTRTGGDQVAVVGCGAPSAQFRVAGQVQDKTMIAASLFACSAFPGVTSSFWQGEQDEPGTVLCLAPLHP